MDFSKLNHEEMLDLLDRAKDAYYNSGEEILSDAEYDELEKLAGLENKNYVGSKKGNYDVKHAFRMGSLSKTQVKQDPKTLAINWEECADDIESYLRKANGANYYETTPKLDGCSFSAEFSNRNGKAYLRTVATRGNGEWGTDIKHWFKPLLNTDYWSKIDQSVNALCEKNSTDILCIRGEVLVKQSTFSEKYVNQYAMPRSIISGVLGLKVEDASEEKLAQGQDLHFVCYDYRLYSGDEYEELSWMNPNDPSYSKLRPYLNHIGELPEAKYCQVHKFDGVFTEDDLEEIYDEYDKFRKEESDYALDGIVFKPECSARRYNIDRPRPVDCIAMKFMPMINSTEIIDFEWNVGKTGEYIPKAILAPVRMPDGKEVTRAAAHNYGWVITNNCGIGSKVRVSLAGDIIPFIYEIVEHKDAKDNMNAPTDAHVVTEPKSGAMHLMKEFTADEEQKNKFITSAETLNINSIGPAAAEDIYYALNDEIDELTNIIYVMNDDAYRKLTGVLGNGKSIQNYIENMKQFAKHITIEDIIRSFNFKQCGKKASEVCARILSGLSYSTSSLPKESYEWALDKNSKEYYLVTSAIEDLGADYLEEEETNEDRIPIIMTGSPEECTEYPTKQKWIQAHPQYLETTSWKECKILFCDDLDSKTGKMQKATKLGIEIKRYDQADGGSGKAPTKKESFDFNKDNSLELF